MNWTSNQMMKIFPPANKNKWLSNAILLSFIFLVLATATLSHLLKTPVTSNKEIIEQVKVFTSEELKNIKKITLTNKSGEYTFEREEIDPASPWHMISPRPLSSSSNFIGKLFAALSSIKTKKLLPDDRVNNSNFSLENPTTTLTLIDASEKRLVLKLGILNTIDNSTYLKISGKKGIFHVEAPSLALENSTMANLIESNVFNLDFKNISSFKIVKKNVASAQFEITKKDGIWMTSKGVVLNTKRLEDALKDFLALKTNYVIEEESDAQKKQIQALINPAEYQIEIGMAEGPPLSYKVSKVTDTLVDIPLNNEPHFLVVQSGSPTIYAVKKDFLSVFELKNESLKDLEIPN